MRIGVYIGDYQPSSGGGYTFVRSVLTSFLQQAARRDDAFVIICHASFAKQLAKEPLPENVSIAVLPTTYKLHRLIAVMRHISPLFQLLWPFTSLHDRIARKQQLDLIWFVGGADDTPKTPFITTVWDVQHLTHPWFPELAESNVWLYRQAFYAQHLRRAMRIITGTEQGRKEIQKAYGVPDWHMALLPHPTPDVPNEPNSDWPEGVPENQPYILYPAQYWAHKNHTNLLLAMAKLKEQGEESPTLVLVGSDKGNKAYIRRRVRELGREDRVLMLGFVSNATLDALYRHAEALVYPSFSGPENLPPLEAFQRDCPVLYADFPGAREQLGKAALYFDPHEPSSIVSAIKTLIEQQEEKQKMIERGRTRAKQWTSEDYITALFDLFDTCITERRCWD